MIKYECYLTKLVYHVFFCLSIPNGGSVTKRGYLPMKRKNSANVFAKECIVTALIELMKIKPYNSISITDIANRAGVSRMAYYRNYVSKDDILNKYMEEVGEHIHEILSRSCSAGDAHTYFRTLHIELGEHSDIGIATYRAHLGELIYQNVKKYMRETFLPNDTSAEAEYRISSCAGGFYAVFLYWICNGKKENPEDLAKICCRTIPILELSDTVV